MVENGRQRGQAARLRYARPSALVRLPVGDLGVGDLGVGVPDVEPGRHPPGVPGSASDQLQGLPRDGLHRPVRLHDDGVTRNRDVHLRQRRIRRVCPLGSVRRVCWRRVRRPVVIVGCSQQKSLRRPAAFIPTGRAKEERGDRHQSVIRKQRVRCHAATATRMATGGCHFPRRQGHRADTAKCRHDVG